MKFNQEGLGPHDEKTGVMEMGGHGKDEEEHMVTEAAIRAFYDHYRHVMELAG